MNKIPKLSVILPVYNAEEYIKEAVESVLKQSFTDFEFIIFNDCSKDKSAEILESFEDDRIRLIHAAENKGYLHHLNAGIEMAIGDYIARMDADDICHPHRFLKQVEMLDSDDQLIVVGSDLEIFGSEERYQSYPSGDLECRQTLLFRSCFAHPAAMMRKNILIDKAIRYRSEFYTAEDYDLWLRLSKFGRFANLNEALLNYRISDGSISVSRKEEQFALKRKLQINAFRLFFQEELSEEESKVYSSLMNPFTDNIIDWQIASSLFNRISGSKEVQPELKSFLLKKLSENALYSLNYNTDKGPKQLRGFSSFAKKTQIDLGLLAHFKLIVKSLFRLKA